MSSIVSPRVAVGVGILLALAWPSAQAQGTRAPSLYRESYALEAKREYPAALAKVREAKQAGSNAYFANLRMGWLSYLAGDYVASAASYADAVTAEPKAIEPKLGRTLPLLAAGNWRELERACREVLSLDAQNVSALSRLAIAQYNSGNFADAAASYRKLIDAYPSDLDFKTGLGWALLKQGRTGDARPLFEAVLAVSPDNLNALKGLGR
ncbi:MAG: tetratricopeptide repeat protein [Gemmatimonadaceae bacterium]|nr:tetratricopeptide repeat protein [Gemmatimonadaceae bacterium]